MESNTYDKILKMFCGEGWQLHPFYQNNNVYATDGRKAVKMNKELPSLKYEDVNVKNANVENVFSKFEDKKGKIVDLKKLEESIEIPLVDDFRICETCEGNGYRRCNLGEEHECDDCYGEGRKYLNNGKKIKDEKCVVEMFGRNICYDELKFLFIVGNTLKVNEMSIVFGQHTSSATLFIIENIEILLISAFVDNDTKIVKNKYEKN